MNCSIFSVICGWLLLTTPSALSAAVFPKADTTSFPVPKGIANLMFYIQRDPNANTVCYALNLDNHGNLNKEEPLDIFWMKYAEDGRRQDLNYIQRVFAYGIKVKKLSRNEIEFRSVAYDKLPLYLREEVSGYRVYTTINGEECVLKRIYVRIDGGSMFSPNVLYVQVEGTNRRGKPRTERIKP